MTASIGSPTGHQHRALHALRSYLGAVTARLGIGLESCMIDHDSPVSAYVALDARLPHYPDRDVALLWDECHGWSIAIETHSGEDLIVLRYLGETLTPEPRRVAQFLAAVRADDHALGQPQPPILRIAGDLADLAEVFDGLRRTGAFGR